MASIIKRGAYSYQVKIRKEGFPPVSKTFSDKKTAETWAKMTESEMERGLWLNRTDSERVTMSELFDRYGQEVSPRKKIYRQELGSLKKLTEEFGKTSLAGLQAKHIASWRDKLLKKGMAGASVIKLQNLLAHVVDQALKEWGYVLAANPVRLVSKPKAAAGRDRRLQPGELDKILEHAQSGFLKSVILFALETAMRRGEIVALRWKDIDLQKRVATLYDTKNGENRAVPLSGRAIDILQALPRRIDVRVFPYTSAGSITQGFEIACRRAGIEGLRFHDLRHEATSRLFESGRLETMEVAAVTGHKTLSMLKRYTHLRAEELARKLG